MVDDTEPLRPLRRVGQRAILIVAVAGVVTTLVVVAAIGAGRRSDGQASPAIAPNAPADARDPGSSLGPSSITVGPPAASTATTTTTFAFPVDYVGDVWVTLSPAGEGTREVTITWGPWARVVSAPAGRATTYRFRKSFDPSGTPTPAVVVGGEPVIGVEFGYGVPPAGAVDINEGWVAVPQGPNA